MPGNGSPTCCTIADPRVLRLIRKYLRAGVSEDGQWSKTEVGTPQGAVISPLLANIYLHYVLDLWVHWWRSHQGQGEVYIVRYCDDFVLGFQYRSDAERFQAALHQRLAKFALELNEDKTRLIEFGRFAAANRKKRGAGRPETFASDPRQEPCAAIPHAGICAGGAGRPVFLPRQKP